MNRKEELIKLLGDYKTEYQNLQEKILEVNKNTEYTQEGRDKIIAGLQSDFASTVTTYHDRGVELIDQGMETLVESWRKGTVDKLLDSDYQAGFSNVIKMLELKAVQKKDDLQNIIDTYAGDYNAISVIETILKNSKNEVWSKGELDIPADNRDKTKTLLMQLRNNIDRYISSNSLNASSKSWNAFNQDAIDVSSSMDSMAQFVRDKLGDNLELLE